MSTSAKKNAPLHSIECREGIVPVWCNFTAMRDPKGLVVHPHNNNLHDEHQIEVMKAALKANGWRENVVVSQTTGRIVAGHLRVLTAISMGMEKIPVDEQYFETNIDEVRHLTADNELARLATFDPTKFYNMKEDAKTAMKDNAFQLAFFNPHEWGLSQFPTLPGESSSKDKPATLMLLQDGDEFQLASHVLKIGSSTPEHEPYLQKFLKGWKKVQGVEAQLFVPKKGKKPETYSAYSEVMDQRKEELNDADEE